MAKFRDFAPYDEAYMDGYINQGKECESSKGQGF